MKERKDDPPSDVISIADIEKTTVCLPRDRLRRLRERAGRRESTVSAVLRGAIDHYLLGQSGNGSRLESLQREAAERILHEEFALEDEQIAALLA